MYDYWVLGPLGWYCVVSNRVAQAMYGVAYPARDSENHPFLFLVRLACVLGVPHAEPHLP